MERRYGLRMDGKLLGFTSTSNSEGDFCVGVCYSLDTYSNNVWLVQNRETAERAAVTDEHWFNADYDTPQNSYVDQGLEVVAVVLSVQGSKKPRKRSRT